MTDPHIEPLPPVFVRTYESQRDMESDGCQLSQQSYVVWSGVSAGRIHRAVYVPRERQGESSLRWHFGAVFDQLRAIVNRHDPYGLLSLGCPDDEYEGEVSRILATLGEAQSEHDALKLTLDEFTESFASPPYRGTNPEAARQLGREMWQAWCGREEA